MAFSAARLSRWEVASRASKGIEFAAAFPERLRSACSTLRELFGAAKVFKALAPILQGGAPHGCHGQPGVRVSWAGSFRPSLQGGRAWGEFVSGGSPHEELQQLAIHLPDVQIEQGFSLTFEWVPRDRKVRADYLSHVSAMQHHNYRLLCAWFEYLDGLWNPHSINRFATAANRQRLCAPNTGRFCSHYFHPDAEWTDAFSIAWRGENNWLFPPTHVVGVALAHLRASGAEGTRICPDAPWASWWHLPREDAGWAHDVLGVQHLGAAESALLISRPELRLFGRGGVLAIRVGRRSERGIPGGDPAPGGPPRGYRQAKGGHPSAPEEARSDGRAHDCPRNLPAAGAGRLRPLRCGSLPPRAGPRARHAEPLRRGVAGLCGTGGDVIPTRGGGALRQLPSGDGGDGPGLRSDETAHLRDRCL